MVEEATEMEEMKKLRQGGSDFLQYFQEVIVSGM